MKKISLYLLALVTSCTLISSCGGGEEEETLNIKQGEWKLYEQTIKTSNTDLDNMLNIYVFPTDIKENDTTRKFSELSVKTIVRKKDTSDSQGLIMEFTDPYTTKGDSMYIESTLYGGIIKAKYLLTNNMLITYKKVNSQDIRNIVTIMGVDPYTIPEGITGELKIKETR